MLKDIIKEKLYPYPPSPFTAAPSHPNMEKQFVKKILKTPTTLLKTTSPNSRARTDKDKNFLKKSGWLY
jgi:hypothetical protein